MQMTLTAIDATRPAEKREGRDKGTTPVTIRRAVLPIEEITERLAVTNRHGCNPRPLNLPHVGRLADDMTAGRWGNDSAETISLCSHGGFLNGKHRAHAAVQSGIPLTCWVAENVPHREFVHMDAHRQRNYADLAAMAGVQRNQHTVASAIRLLGFYDHRRDVPWPLWRTGHFLSRDVFMEWAKEYHECENYKSLANALRSKAGATSSTAYAVSYLLHREVKDAQALGVFFDALITGAISSAKDPRLILRNYLLTSKTERRGSEQLGAFLTAWNWWATGRGRTIKLSPTAPMPDVVQFERGQGAK